MLRRLGRDLRADPGRVGFQKVDLAVELDAPLLGQVPLDIALRESGDRGIPVVVGVPQSASARALTKIAAELRPVRRGLAGRQLGLAVVERPKLGTP